MCALSFKYTSGFALHLNSALKQQNSFYLLCAEENPDFES